MAAVTPTRGRHVDCTGGSGGRRRGATMPWTGRRRTEANPTSGHCRATGGEAGFVRNCCIAGGGGRVVFLHTNGSSSISKGPRANGPFTGRVESPVLSSPSSRGRQHHKRDVFVCPGCRDWRWENPPCTGGARAARVVCVNIKEPCLHSRGVSADAKQDKPGPGGRRGSPAAGGMLA